jgi:23S rRNA pseudouridine1911/1915/1917 synthase
MSSMASYKSFIDNAFKICPRQALHAFSLGFIHPITNEFMQFEQKFPVVFLAVFTKLRAING